MSYDQQQNEEPTIGRLVTDASRDISTLISKEIEVSDVNDAFAAMQNGEVARSVIRYDVTS